MKIQSTGFIRDFLLLSKHWPTDASKSWPSLKDIVENLAFYPLFALFISTIRSALKIESALLNLSAVLMGALVLILLVFTAIQTFSLLLSSALGAIGTFIPRNRVFHPFGAGPAFRRTKVFLLLALFVGVPAVLSVVALVVVTFSLSVTFSGLLDG